MFLGGLIRASPVQPSANDRKGFTDQIGGVVSRIGKRFHKEGADKPERQKVSHSRADGLLSQKGLISQVSHNMG